MKRINKLAILAALINGGIAVAADGRHAHYQPYQDQSRVVRASHCACGDAACGCEDACDAEPTCDAELTCDGGCDSGCDAGSGCGGGLAAGLGFGSLMTCDIGEPWSLVQATPLGISVGGWTNLGYHSSRNAGTGINGNGAPANFNTYDGRVQLQQQWAYAERVADGSEGLDIGGRIDYLYGTDAPDTQTFGIANDHWDNGFDNGGAYGHSIPQVYGEVALGNTSVKLGHFFTIVGNEVVAATGNFFYSRQFTFYNAEPFTHTGALATTNVGDDWTFYYGYVMGWDSGFEDNGDAFLGGVKKQISDDVSLLYTTCIGRFGDRPTDANGNTPTASGARERGSIHSFILTTQLTDNLTNLIQYDYLDTNDEDGVTVRRTHGLNAYFIYQVNDCVSLGSRSEYFNWTTPQTDFESKNLFNQTVGVNYRLHANLLVRPEVRWVYDPQRTGINELNVAGQIVSKQATFGMDAIVTF